jgi:hypothetical protein
MAIAKTKAFSKEIIQEILSAYSKFEQTKSTT